MHDLEMHQRFASLDLIKTAQKNLFWLVVGCRFNKSNCPLKKITHIKSNPVRADHSHTAFHFLYSDYCIAILSTKSGNMLFLRMQCANSIPAFSEGYLQNHLIFMGA